MVHIGENESTLYDYIDNAIASLVTSGSGTDRVQNDVGHSSVESSDNSFPTDGNSTESSVSNQSNTTENEGRHGRSIPTARNNETNPETSKPIIIRVRDQTGEETFFKIKMTTKMSKVFNVYATRKSVQISSLCFLFKGERIEESQTVEGLGLANHAQIDCMMRSFLPNSTRMNAWTFCDNLQCNNKEGASFTLKMRTGYRSVYYCNDACQKTHFNNHKQQCMMAEAQHGKEMKEILVTMIKQGIEENSDGGDVDDDDDELFQPILPQDDCPICTLPLPIGTTEKVYISCCGKVMCLGCWNQAVRVTRQFPLCAFCREPTPTDDDELIIRRIKQRMEMNDSAAILIASQFYQEGIYGLQKDPQLAFDLCLRAAKLGNADACSSIAMFYKNDVILLEPYACSRTAMIYNNNVVVQKDMVKSTEYLKKATKKGSIQARHNLGMYEARNGNYRVACKHWLISAAAGDTKSLEAITDFSKIGIVTMEEYTTALISYRKVHKDGWSIERKEVCVTRLL